jgi:hypothetical protein
MAQSLFLTIFTIQKKIYFLENQCDGALLPTFGEIILTIPTLTPGVCYEDHAQPDDGRASEAAGDHLQAVV